MVKFFIQRIIIMQFFNIEKNLIDIKLCIICVFILVVKCNDDYVVLKLLFDIGVNFDCVSKVGDLVYELI